MEKNNPNRIIIHRMPLVTLSVLFLCVCATIFSQITAVIIYDRNAISCGEIWRLISCHFVHFNNAHLAYNLLAFGIAGLIIENKGYPYFKSLCFLISLSIGLVIFYFRTNMAFYGGLSGLACGSIFYFAFWGLYETKHWRIICLILIFSISLEIILEFVNGSSLLPYLGTKTFTIVPLSHLTGSIVAFIVFTLGREKQKLINQEAQKPWEVKSLTIVST
ncbi:MAG: rhombosortase [Proteobacteria bacterium]|nr:rhombosortase [Pseudomonadota bacterium]MBU1716483.1 rhombosortase [Pseudomonadota bacterium]